MRISDIEEVAHRVLTMMNTYRGASGQGELGADRVLYGYLQGRYGNFTRQHPVPDGRIDFRQGSSNPMVLELVLRQPGQARSVLFASQNRSELRKLTKVRQSTARTRVLLLLDRARTPVAHAELKYGYDASNAGRGNFTRHPVRVIYSHSRSTYHFLWRPTKQQT